MINVLAGAFGFLGAFIAHDLAAQSLGDLPLRPLTGTCPRCGNPRGWAHGVCPQCGRRVGRELLFALLATGFAVAFANTLGQVWALLAYLGFLILTLALGITDIDALRIVDRLNLRGTLLVVGALAVGSFADGTEAGLARGLLGGAAYFVGTNLVFLLVRGRGFGYGDVKLSAQLGVFTAFLSWGTLGWSVFLTALIGGVLSIGFLLGGVVTRARAKRTGGGGSAPSVRDAMKVELPYGPSMILGAWISITLAGLGAFPIPT